MNTRPCWATLLCLLATTGANAQSALDVRYSNGRLSIQAQQVPMSALLQRITQQAGIQLDLAAGISETPVNWSVCDQPLETALLELVRPNNLLILYEPSQAAQQAARIVAVSVLPPVPAHEPTAVIPPEAAHASPTPPQLSRLIVEPGDWTQRRQAIADLAMLSSPDVVRELEQALAVSEPELRQDVVLALGSAYGDAPPTALGQIVMGDSDGQVRVTAIQALAQRGDTIARLFIEQALKDPDETIRAVARQALVAFVAR